MNVVGAAAQKEEDPDHPWSPGTLQYYGRAELKTSDHRYRLYRHSLGSEALEHFQLFLCTLNQEVFPRFLLKGPWWR